MTDYDDLRKGIESLDEATLQAIYEQEATIAVRGSSGKVEQKKMLSKAQLTQIRAQLLEELKKETTQAELMDKGMVKIKKREGLPRTLTIIKLKNNQYGVMIETKSKLESEKIDREKNKKAKGKFKHGTPCIMLWPREKNKPNKRWWNSVQTIDAENSYEDARKESGVSQKNHPFIQAEIIGTVYDRNKVNTYSEASTFGDFTSQSEYTKDDIRRILGSYLLGIAYLHNHRPPIIHRDIKPNNMLIFQDEQGRFFSKVSDFGLSAFNLNLAVGTAHYFSPQLLKGRTDIDEEFKQDVEFFSNFNLAQSLYKDQLAQLPRYRASTADDVWAIGVMLFEVITNGEEKDIKKIKQLVNRNSPEYKALAENIETDKASNEDKMWFIMANCLQLKNEDRFTISDIIKNLPDQRMVEELRKIVNLSEKKEQTLPGHLDLLEIYKNAAEFSPDARGPKILTGFNQYAPKKVTEKRILQLELLQDYYDNYIHLRDRSFQFKGPKEHAQELEAAIHLKAAVEVTRASIKTELHLLKPKTVSKILDNIESYLSLIKDINDPANKAALETAKKNVREDDKERHADAKADKEAAKQEQMKKDVKKVKTTKYKGRHY